MNLYIVLGYLASGKTTFVKNFLNKLSNSKNAVIVNDFGEKDVDGVILKEYVKNLKSIYDGSIFCSCKSDMFCNALIDMDIINPDNIIVEASGLANPFTMLNILDTVNKKVNNRVELKGVICLVDINNFEKIYSVCHAISMQIACSDIILLNKTDLAANAAIFRVNKLVRELNKNAKIILTKNAVLEDYSFNIVDKSLPLLIEDLTIQKLQLKLNNPYTKDMLENLSKELFVFCHRIKGIVTISKNYIYEYTGENCYKETLVKDNYLILLSVLKENLKQKTKNILLNYKFAEIVEDKK